LLASFLWTSLIATNFHNLVINRQSLPDNVKISMKSIAVGYILPLVYSLIVYFTLFADIVDPSDVEQSNTDDYSFLKWGFVAFYFPLWFCILLNTVLYWKIARFLSIMNQSRGSLRYFLEFFWYPLILIFSWILNSVFYGIMIFGGYCSRSQDWQCETISGDGECEKYPDMPGELPLLLMVANMICRFQGFFNAVAYLTTPSIWKQIKDTMKQVYRVGSQDLGVSMREPRK